MLTAGAFICCRREIFSLGARTSAVPRTQTAAVALLAAGLVALPVVAGPLATYTSDAAAQLLERRQYLDAVLHKAQRVPTGVNSTTGAAVANARRAILVGAQAAAFAVGQGSTDPQKMSWVEETFDYGNQLGVSAGLIFGLKKLRFNSQDFGTFVAPPFSPQP